MSRALLLCFLISLPMLAQQGQQVMWHRVTGSFGAFTPAAGRNVTEFGTAPVLAFDYGYRFSRYGQFDAGVDIAFAKENGIRRNVYLPRAGYSLLVPLWSDRVEAIFGGGAGYSFYKPTVEANEMWLVYLQGGANYGIDLDGRYRAGMLVRWYRDPLGAPVQQWVSVAATISYSFGR